jgi:hypothetical protein
MRANLIPTSMPSTRKHSTPNACTFHLSWVGNTGGGLLRNLWARSSGCFLTALPERVTRSTDLPLPRSRTMPRCDARNSNCIRIPLGAAAAVTPNAIDSSHLSGATDCTQDDVLLRVIRVRGPDIAESAPWSRHTNPSKGRTIILASSRNPAFAHKVRMCLLWLPALHRFSSIQIENVRDRAFSGGSTLRSDGINGSFCHLCRCRTCECQKMRPGESGE